MRQLLTILCFLMLAPIKAQRLVKEFAPNNTDCFINYLGNLDTGFVFASFTTEYGLEPWISDGTENGTRLLKDIFPGQSSSMVTDFIYEADSLIYFVAQVSNTYSLWRTNGTTEGTFKLFDFGIDIPNKFYKQGIFYKGQFYFLNPNNRNSSLWSTDGTVTGTKAVYNFNDSGMERIVGLNEWKGQMYFFAGDQEHGTELWTSDGTIAGTYMLKDIFPGITKSINLGQINMVGLDKQLFFTAKSNEEQNYELFSTDGTEAGTKLFKDFAPEIYVSSFPSIVKGNDSFFLINTNTKAWKSDGTLKNTGELYKDPNDSLGYSYVFDATPYKGNYLFNFYNNQSGTELYLGDGQFNHLKMIKDINPGVSSSGGDKLFSKGNKLYFFAFNNMLGRDIWVTDGTFDNTLVFLELAVNRGNETLIEWKNRLFFIGVVDVQTGSELYELVFNSTGIKKNSIATYNLYPNPIKAGAFLHVSDLESNIVLFNVHGQKVLETEAREGKVQIPEHLSKGIYSIRIRTDNNETHHKIVIE